MTARRLQKNYKFCIQGYLQEKGVRFYIPYELEHRHGLFSIKNWPYTDVKKPTNRYLIKILNNQRVGVKATQCSPVYTFIVFKRRLIIFFIKHCSEV